jgi:predicted NBD/HSP70 family sugar kinase
MSVIAVDLGGTNTRIALFDDTDSANMIGTPHKRRNTHVYEQDLAYIVKTAQTLADGSPIDGLGIGVPGGTNDDKSDMVGSNNLPEWTNQDFPATLAKALHCPVYIDNDGVAAGLGEGYYGDMQSDFHFVIWGTGIGCDLVEHTPDGNIIATHIRPNYHAHFQAWENGRNAQRLVWISVNPSLVANITNNRRITRHRPLDHNRSLI